MTNEWKYLIYLYKCSVFGDSANAPDENIDWKKLLELASNQSVSAIVSLSLKKADFVPDDIRQECSAITLSSALSNMQRTQVLFDTLDCLSKNGFTPIILKGLDIARFYKVPDCRTSADNDLFFPFDDEHEVLDALSQIGYKVEERKEGMNHGEASHPKGGTIETHAKLYSDTTASSIFGAYKDELKLPDKFKTIPFLDSGKEIFVLLPDDAILFLAVHLVKHFIYCGISIRQAFDFALYFSKCKDEIDTENFWALCEKFGFRDFLFVLLSMFIYEGCFDESDFDGLVLQDKELCDKMSDNIEKFSTKVMPTFDTWNYYYFRHLDNADKNIRKQRKREHRRIVLGALFPSADELERNYGFLKNRHYLYPVAFMMRGFSGLFSKEKKQSLSKTVTVPKNKTAKEDETVSFDAERIGLLSDFKLMK